MHRLLPMLLAVPVLAQTPATPPLAFPGALGPAAHITGGRGGELYVVTNTHASGPGSLAEGVSKGNRIIVFAVSGLIDLTERKKDKLNGGEIRITEPNVTILGQTAPGEGICLKGGVLSIEASNVIVRHLRSRRGFIREADAGDAIEVKPPVSDELATAGGRSQEVFDKTAQKKKERGKEIKTFAPLSDILIDHCSTSWATDENLTCTHADRSTVQWCIAAEGLDYANPKQTPANHSEGSLWGSAAPNGTSLLHHTLYAHNRLRNPRSTGGSDQPPVLTLANTVVYNWSELATHTGSEVVLVNWLGNYYKPGPDTPADIAATGFTFSVSPDARLHASGNVFTASPEATKDNRLAVAYASKLRKLTDDERQRMIVDRSFGPSIPVEPADGALSSILEDGGATLPSRDSVDLRILRSVRDGTGRIIGKETDLPEDQRWPDYHSQPAPADADRDGLPDAWQQQFNVKGAMTISATGHAMIEHYANNTDPTGGSKPVVHVQTLVSRSTTTDPGVWKITRSGDLSRPLAVEFHLSHTGWGGAAIPADQASTTFTLRDGTPGASIVLSLLPGDSYAVGCPSQSLVVVQ